ncbi:MAG: rRNA cytosine-C5-methylase [Rubritepida sp.]|nr:rRNA cytosine-C5-methylase [Rubritepida sp.]
MAEATPARRAAAHLLETVLEQHRGLEEGLDSLPAMDARDRAAGHRIAATVLRRLGSLDAALEPFLRRAPPAPAQRALRIGAAELLLLGTPPHAAVASAVALAPRPLAGLVNAVLRRLAAEGPAALEGLDAERLDTPAWLWAAWHAAHGARVRAIAAAHRAEAPLDLTLRPGAPPPPGATLLPTGTARLPPGTRILDLPGFADGAFWAQDAAAGLPARLLAPQPGERIADLCAAPGGKTAQLAAAGAEVFAVEREAARLPRLRENMARLHLSPTIVHADAATWAPPAPLDAILLDAPCTATGTIRRHPDVAHLKRPKDVARHAAEQRRLLAAAARMLRPGGRLVFATCSLQPEEGEAHLASLPEGMQLDPIRPEELPGLGAAITPAGALRTAPDLWAEAGGMDGFFAMRLRRYQ